MDKMTERLTRALDLLKYGWTRYAEARDSYGEAISPMSPDACKWCLIGALRRAGSGDLPEDIIVALRDTMKREILVRIESQLQKSACRNTLPSYWAMSSFNDTYTQESVLRLITDTIQRLQGV